MVGSTVQPLITTKRVNSISITVRRIEKSQYAEPVATGNDGKVSVFQAESGARRARSVTFGNNPKNTMNHYKAPWGKSLIVISSLGVGICLFVAAFSILMKQSTVLWPATIPLAALCISLLFTIRGYTLSSDAVLIHRLLWETRLSLADLESSEFIPKAMKGSIRTFGNGGLFSFTGFFRNRTLGSYRAFVTDLNQTVVLRFPKRTVVVSPDRPVDFVQSINGQHKKS
jgi:hypothetical protein